MGEKIKSYDQVFKNVTRALKTSSVFSSFEENIVKGNYKEDFKSFLYNHPLNDSVFMVGDAEYYFNKNNALTSYDEYNSCLMLYLVDHLSNFSLRSLKLEEIAELLENGKGVNTNEVFSMILYGCIVSCIGVSIMIILFYIAFGLISTMVISFIMIMMLLIMIDEMNVKLHYERFH